MKAETTKKSHTTAVIIFITAVAIAFPSGAQNLDVIKNLRSQLADADDEKKFQLLSSIGFEFRYSYPDSTLIYCNRAFELGQKIGIETGLSKPISFIGLAYGNKGDYKNSIEYHRRAIDLALGQNDLEQLGHGYNNLGRMFYDQGDLVRAFDNFIRSKEIFEDLGDKSGLAYVNRSLANLYSTQKQFDEALKMSQVALSLRKEMGETRMIVSSLMELGIIYRSAGERESALKFFLKADSASEGINDAVTHAEISIGLAEILLEEGKLKEAFDRTEQVLKAIKEQTNQKMFLRATYLQAKYHYQKRDYTRATALLRTTLESAESSGNVVFQRDASYLLAEIYNAQNDKPRAREYLNRYEIFSGMLETTDLARQVERLQFQVEIERRDRENEILKAQDAKNTATITKQRVQNILLVVIVISITTIAAILWINSRKRRLTNHKLALQNSHIASQREEISHHNEDLSRSNQVLSDLNQEKNTLMNIVAHDLKAPLNRISGLASIIEMEEGLSGKQKNFVKLIRDATTSGLDLITDLLDVNALEEVRDAPNKSDVAIGPLLEERVKLLQVNANSKSIKLDLSVDVTRPVTTDSNYIIRIVDNLLTNAIKFSRGGSEVKVTAATDNDALVLSVKDNGPGFQDEDRPFLFQKFKKLSARPTGGESSNGLGLAIVKTLVDRLKGDIRLETARGKGSEFIITLPL